ncbi:hypothetical protein D5086_026934 [Populus alba]|uniref:Uncharacterized protein n=1 Tax=Populus alba TaxID=43335 RepID=A0ACC4B3H0_POPAL
MGIGPNEELEEEFSSLTTWVPRTTDTLPHRSRLTKTLHRSPHHLTSLNTGGQKFSASAAHHKNQNRLQNYEPYQLNQGDACCLRVSNLNKDSAL